MKKILFLHALSRNFRDTTFRHVCAFPRYGKGNLFVMHHLKAPVTKELRQIEFDGIIIHYCFLGHRIRKLPLFTQTYDFVKQSSATKIAITMDDYTHSGTLDRWLDEFGVKIVYSPITRDLDVLYPKMFQKDGVEFRPALTGYVDNDMLSDVETLTLPLSDRKIDVGTRVKAIGPHLGRHAQKKSIISVGFCTEAAAAGFVTDCSTDAKDVFLGKDWLRFLGSCRTTIGSRGGASVADIDGSLRAKCDDYLQAHPDAPYEEVKAACFPDVIDTYRFDATGPRLLEAASTYTCQVLVLDEYLGLEPYKDYIPLQEDFSNLSEVFAMMRDSETLSRISSNAHRKLIASKQFSLERFVEGVLDSVPSGTSLTPETVELVARHFHALQLFSTVEADVGSVPFQLIKHYAKRAIRSRASIAAKGPRCRSAISELFDGEEFPKRPDIALEQRALANWTADKGVDLQPMFAELSNFEDPTLHLEEWGFCECILDD
ncbi:MAG: hypothetical protein A49_05610 [Methyloceanibacter sp.]|nr:MAG: hypothetical protein A49_05610 [Methyloceanibacter sp.]